MSDIFEKQKSSRISVVVATYNGERFLEEQLDSIMHQTLLPDEIVISDDGSTDKTEQIINRTIARYEKTKTRFIFCRNHSTRHGVTGNFENGIKNAHGEYVFLCDQDDIWYERKIEKVVGLFMQQEGVNVIIHDAEVIEEASDGHFQKSGQHLMPPYRFDDQGLCRPDGEKEISSLLHLWGVINGMCICARREFLFSIMPFSEGAYHDQWILFCGFSNQSVLAVNDTLACYRVHGHNTVGVEHFKRERSFSQRIQALFRIHARAEERLRAYYVWYSDTLDYSGKRPEDPELSRKITYFTHDRLAAMTSNKIRGMQMLRGAYAQGFYQSDGKILYYLDLVYLLTCSRRKRQHMIDTLNDHLRAARMS